MSPSALPDDLRAALVRLAVVPQLLVTSDYDGVLAPLVGDPAAATPEPASLRALVELGALPRTTAALVSGRARAELLTLSGVPPEIEAVGSHGAEFAAGFAGGLDDAAVALHSHVGAELRRIAEGQDGVGLEVKTASVALHVRNASRGTAEQVLTQVREGPATWDGVHTTEGKSVIELAVLDTDKGEALDVLRDSAGADAALFLGDDVTDEKAFRRLRDGDVGVKVGDGDTLAGYRVADTDAVTAVLQLLLDTRRSSR